MARGKSPFLNFREPVKKPKSGAGSDFTDAQQVTYYRNLFLGSNGGDFANADSVDRYIRLLQGVDQTPEVQVEIATMQAKRASLDNTQRTIGSSLTQLQDNLAADLRQATLDNSGDLNGLVSTQALIYAAYSEKADSLIQQTLENYGVSTPLDETFYKFKEDVTGKEAYLTSLSAQLNSPELIGSFDPETVTVQITTNPTNGVINDIKIVPRGAGDKGYSETNIKMKIRDGVPPVPVSLNYLDTGRNKDGVQQGQARLGNTKFFGTFTKLTDATGKEIGDEYGSFVLNAADANNNPIRKGQLKDLVENGASLSDFTVDGNNIAQGSVIRKGTRLFYVSDENNIKEFGGENYSDKVSAAQKFLAQMGDSNPDKAFYPQSVSDSYLNRPNSVDGRASRITGIIAPQDPLALPVSLENQSVATTPPEDKSFFSQGPQFTPAVPFSQELRTSQPNKPEAAAESSGGSPLFSDIIEKGKSFFRRKA